VKGTSSKNHFYSIKNSVKIAPRLPIGLSILTV